MTFGSSLTELNKMLWSVNVFVSLCDSVDGFRRTDAGRREVGADGAVRRRVGRTSLGEVEGFQRSALDSRLGLPGSKHFLVQRSNARRLSHRFQRTSARDAAGRGDGAHINPHLVLENILALARLESAEIEAPMNS